MTFIDVMIFQSLFCSEEYPFGIISDNQMERFVLFCGIVEKNNWKKKNRELGQSVKETYLFAEGDNNSPQFCGSVDS